MIIVNVDGGLGNQMFQYAFLLQLKSKGYKTKIDISKFAEQNCKVTYDLESVFGIQEEVCTSLEKRITKMVSKVMFLISKKLYKEAFHEQGIFMPKAADTGYGYLKGYWQSPEYFKSIKEIVKNAYKFSDLAEQENINTAKLIGYTNSVSIHIRRGDYLTDGRSCTLDLDYYERAINYIEKRIEEPHYFIFSDDIEWTKSKLALRNTTFVHWNSGAGSLRDMQLMSLCKNNIIANSSFSWWGAWLNANRAKIVVAPDKWMPHLNDTRDIIPNDWHQVKSSFESTMPTDFAEQFQK